MIKIVNNFLNFFEGFLKRLFIVTIATIALPFILLSFLFGFWDFKVNKEDE